MSKTATFTPQVFVSAASTVQAMTYLWDARNRLKEVKPTAPPPHPSPPMRSGAGSKRY